LYRGESFLEPAYVIIFTLFFSLSFLRLEGSFGNTIGLVRHAILSIALCLHKSHQVDCLLYLLTDAASQTRCEVESYRFDAEDVSLCSIVYSLRHQLLCHGYHRSKIVLQTVPFRFNFYQIS
jgi:hypothetical protein